MKFNGLIAASCTPFRSDFELDTERIPGLTDYLAGLGLAGLFVCGSTGECSSMTADERKTAAELFIASARKRLPVIVHVGSQCVRESELLAAHAEASGADAIAAVAPSYFKPGSVEALVESMRIISAAAPSLPFYFYHIPALTGVCFPMSMRRRGSGSSSTPSLRTATSRRSPTASATRRSSTTCSSCRSGSITTTGSRRTSRNSRRRSPVST